jgi:small subunit ribosomal protein S20
VRRAKNRALKSRITSAARALDAAEGEAAVEKLKEAASVIDRAAKHNVIHWKAAARKKSRLARRVNAKTKAEA